VPKVIFLPTTLDGLPRTSASPRIRARWVARYWDDADVYDGTQALADYDVFIFQKAYLTKGPRQIAARYRDVGKLMLFDCCDPEFEDPLKLDRLMGMLDFMAACVVPTEALAEWFARWLPTYIIPDRLDLALHEPKTGDEDPLVQKGPGVLWFGGSQNYAALETMREMIDGLGIQLVTLSDKPHPAGYEWIRWESVEQANDVIRRADIVVNPQPDWGLFRYKSNNKTVTAWACGVPVAHDEDELRFLLPLREDQRFELGRSYRFRAEDKYDCRQSAEEWRQVIDIEGQGGQGA